jgi:hypothetical protein
MTLFKERFQKEKYDILDSFSPFFIFVSPFCFSLVIAARFVLYYTKFSLFWHCGPQSRDEWPSFGGEQVQVAHQQSSTNSCIPAMQLMLRRVESTLVLLNSIGHQLRRALYTVHLALLENWGAPIHFLFLTLGSIHLPRIISPLLQDAHCRFLIHGPSRCFAGETTTITELFFFVLLRLRWIKAGVSITYPYTSWITCDFFLKICTTPVFFVGEKRGLWKRRWKREKILAHFEDVSI